MTAAEKKEYANRLIENGDKRSYSEIMADLELYLWTVRHKGIVETENISDKKKDNE